VKIHKGSTVEHFGQINCAYGIHSGRIDVAAAA
jgi:hypothetical protein